MKNPGLMVVFLSLYSFSVRPQEVYTFEGLVANAAADGALELRFVDAAGKDVAETERQLGYSPSIGRTSFRAGSGRVAMTCRAGFADGISPVRGIVTCGSEDKAVALEKRICREFYRPTPDGLCGNDDCGQMSAWYLRRCRR